MLTNLFENSRHIQYLSTLSVGLITLAYTTFVAWPSPTLVLLTSKDSPIGVTLSNARSWVVASLFLGQIPGSIIQGCLLDKLGPKRLLLLGSSMLFVPWILIGFAPSLTLLILGRFLGGVAGGIVMFCTPIYVSEIASKDIRGRLGVIPYFTSVLGATVVFAIGPFVSYIALVLICATFVLLVLFTFPLVPESPYYLMKTGREIDAQKSLGKLSSQSTSAEQIDEMLQEIKETLKCDSEQQTSVQILASSNFRRSMLIVLGAKTISEFSGGYAINSYMQTIMAASHSNLSPEISSVIYSLVQIPSVILAGLLIDRLGRKLLFIVSSFGACFMLIGEGAYFYLQEEVNLDAVSFLPITCLTLYKILTSFGVGPLPYIIFGELFTMDTKKVGGLIFASYAGAVGFLNSKLFATIAIAWGLYTTCWVFASVCVLGIMFGFLVIPETKGKSFRDIQNSLSTRNK